MTRAGLDSDDIKAMRNGIIQGCFEPQTQEADGRALNEAHRAGWDQDSTSSGHEGYFLEFWST